MLDVQLKNSLFPIEIVMLDSNLLVHTRIGMDHLRLKEKLELAMKLVTVNIRFHQKICYTNNFFLKWNWSIALCRKEYGSLYIQKHNAKRLCCSIMLFVLFRNRSTKMIFWNTIENLWEEVERQIPTIRFPNKQSLIEKINEVCSNVPIATTKNLILSMSRRCQKVIANNVY